MTPRVPGGPYPLLAWYVHRAWASGFYLLHSVRRIDPKRLDSVREQPNGPYPLRAGGGNLVRLVARLDLPGEGSSCVLRILSLV